MRLFCHSCGKSVSNELPGDVILRAAVTCPECIEKGAIQLIPVADHVDYFDHVRAVGRVLKSILMRDHPRGYLRFEGTEEYLIRAVDEARRVRPEIV